MKRMIKATTFETKNEMIDEIQNTADQLRALAVPKSSEIGNTYYNNSEIRSSVSNKLSDIVNETYVSYNYGSKTIYRNAYAIKVGGAYLRDTTVRQTLKQLISSLVSLNGGRYSGDTATGIIETWGTNYGVFGFGTIQH